jgi:hypothetical protein
LHNTYSIIKEKYLEHLNKINTKVKISNSEEEIWVANVEINENLRGIQNKKERRFKIGIIKYKK